MVQAAGWRPAGQLGAGGEPGVPAVPARVCLSSSMVIRDLTLRSAASFGSFHLIRLLYDEYMFYLVEHRVAEATGETPIAVMGEVSAPHPHPGTSGQASGSKRTHRGARVWGSAAGRELACPSQTGTGRPWLLSPPYETPGRISCLLVVEYTERIIHLFSHLTVNNQMAFSTFTML